MDSKLIRALVIDDHPVVRAGIQMQLTRIKGITVVGEAGTGEEGLRLVGELVPDLVLLDMALPDLDGVEVTYRVRQTFPHVRVLVFSGYADDAFVFGALEAGASGYLLKDELLERLADAVRATMQGQLVLSDRVARKTLRLREHREAAEEESSPLTDRERAVLRLIALFRTNDEIAAKLSISSKTVEYHVRNILSKLGTTSRREAARWAWDHELNGASLASSD